MSYNKSNKKIIISIISILVIALIGGAIIFKVKDYRDESSFKETVKSEKNNNLTKKEEPVEKEESNKKEESSNNGVSKITNDVEHMTIEVIENTPKNNYLTQYNNIDKEVNSLMKNYYDSNAYEKKEIISQAYEIWDSFINEIWSSLKTSMNEHDFEILTESQVNWIIEKEKKAKEYDGNLDSIYALESLVESTKSRCNYLINYYM